MRHQERRAAVAAEAKEREQAFLAGVQVPPFRQKTKPKPKSKPSMGENYLRFTCENWKLDRKRREERF